MDGWIRIWFYETIDQANSHNGERILEIQPIYEYHISENNGANGSMLMCICKQEPDNPESTFWYAQDGNGGIWLIDLHTLKPELPRKIFTCHAGGIADMANATWGPFVATLSKAGQLHIYNYLKKKLILVHKFNNIGSQVVWFPCQIEATGSTLACAFGNGVIRVITVAISVANATDNVKGDYVRLIQVIKPHKMTITAMSLNPSCSLLVTGSEDSTVFNFTITVTKTFPVVTPIGFIKVPSGVTCLTWKSQYETTLLIGCLRGDCVEVILPSVPQLYTIASYELVQCRPKAFKFHSVKSAIRRELIRLEQEKEKREKIAKKREEIERLIAESPGLEVNEEAFLDIEEEESLPEIYIPKIPNKILMAQYISRDIIWLSMAGFDAGYIYEYPSPEITETVGEEPVKSTIIYDADDTELRSCLFYKGRKYLFLGMEHGQIRVCRWKPENYTDLSDYWILPMHDNYNGHIPKMILSHDQRILFTCGHDGNLFSYEINDDAPLEEIEFEKTKETLSLPYASIEDIEEIDYASLEEMIQQAEYDRIATAAKQRKHQTLEILLKLSEEYSKILERFG